MNRPSPLVPPVTITTLPSSEAPSTESGGGVVLESGRIAAMLPLDSSKSLRTMRTCALLSQMCVRAGFTLS